MGTHYLDRLFAPKTIAVFGANERPDSVAGRVYDNLRGGGFSGPIFAINPKHKRLYGQPCYRSLEAVGEPVELAVIATPAPTIPGILRACGEHGIRNAIVISAGFNPGDERGTELRSALLETARQFQIRILGPNCLGLIRPRAGMNATFSKNTADSGPLALISQSGALCTSILDWAAARDIGFSAIVSLGNAADIGFGDLLDYFAQDLATRSILLYIEGIRDARSFLSGLRIAARMKPVILIKAGRHEAGSRAAVTHSGAMIGADDVFDAALQRAGVVRVTTIEQLFSAAQLLATRHRVNGDRLAVITNGGGLGVMAADRAIDLGITLATLSDGSIARLNDALPAHWSCTNPIDLLGDANESRYRTAIETCLGDTAVDGVMVMLSPQAMTDPLACAQAVIDARGASDKPLLACWMGEQQVGPANRLFAENRLPYFPNPESCVEAFAYLATHLRNQQLLVQVPKALARQSEPDIGDARRIVDAVLAEDRSILTIAESKALLTDFAIPVTRSIACDSEAAALAAAESLGYPVAMKIDSKDITHKSDVGGVRLNLGDPTALGHAFRSMLDEVGRNSPEAKIDGVTIESMYLPVHGRELLVGVIGDPVFGPAITFGAGGIQVEVLRDRAVALPPLNRYLAEQIIDQTRVARLLGRFRDMPAIDREALVQLLRQVSAMVCELPEIEALDINPLVADDRAVMVLDARIVVKPRKPSAGRYDHMAIHPYPSHLVSRCRLADDTPITIRPIRPEDASIERSFVRDLSTESKYFRFMQGLNELTDEMLVRFTQLDYHRELALIAVLERDDRETELGVARYVTNADGKSCEFALVVADQWHRKGIGTRLMRALIDAARERGLQSMNGEILAENRSMRGLVEKLGFSVRRDPGEITLLLASLRL